MEDWSGLRRIWLWALLLLLLPLFGLLVAVGLGEWEQSWQRLLLLTASVAYVGLLLAVAHLIRSQQQDWQERMSQAQEEVLNLTQELRRKADQLTTERDRAEFLHRSGAELTRSLEPRQVLLKILRRAVEAVHAERGSIFLFTPQGQPDEILLSEADHAQKLGPRSREILSRGLAGWVVRNRCGDIVNDTQEDKRWLNFPTDEMPTRSAVAVPFLRRGRVLGVIILLHSLPYQFSQEHQALLQEMAQQAAVCLENADLYTLAEEERRKLSAILRGTTDVVVVVDTDDNLLLANPAAERAFGLDPSRALGQSLAQILPHQRLMDLLGEARESNTAVSGELSTEDGRTRYGTASPISGLGWVVILQDITYLKELDRVKSDFVATVSHDLRSPLTTVRGFADMLSILGPVTPEQQGAVDKIRRAVAQMNDLIGDLLDLGKIEAGIDLEMEPCDIQEIAEEAIDSLQPRAELKQHQLRLDIQAPPPPVMGNANRLRQALCNLVDNAIKYTPDGGLIQVRVGQQDQQVLIVVSDNGLGIAPQDQEQLFQKFYRVNTPQTENIPGTGLGLAMVRSIVEQHGGRIWVRSRLGEGSTFTFSLPLAP
ncbi:MAG: GAF domain-containing protein [Chloroflexia bacterium]|nr:GAF domain-containing protein [Chloroflexia bacterium]